MNHTSPTEVIRLALSHKARCDWRALVELADPESMHLFRTQYVPQAESVVPMTVDDFQESSPDMPAEVAEYLAGRSRSSMRDVMPPRMPHADELAALSDSEFLLRFLEVNDGRTYWEREEAGKGDAAAEHAEVMFPPVVYEVLGEVIKGTVAYVIFTSVSSTQDQVIVPDNVQVVMLRKRGSTWKVHVSHPFLSGGFYIVQSVDVEAHFDDHVPYRPLAVKQMDWVQRRFDHELPPEMFPSVLLRFESAVRRLDLSTLPKRIRTTRLNGKWSVQEHFGHLIDLDALGEQRLDDFIAGADLLTAADMSNRKTEESRHNEADSVELAMAFYNARAKLVERLKTLSAGQIAHSAMHPRLKRRMNVVEWVYFMCEHDDHHFARMNELISELWPR